MFRLRVALAACFCALVLLQLPAFPQDQSAISFSKNQRNYSSAPPLRIQNDLVAVQVRTTNDTSAGGEISYTGNFNIGTPANVPLLNRFPDPPFSSHVNVRVDGRVYSNDPFHTGAALLTLLAAPTLRGDSAIVCDYLAGPVRVRQLLTLNKFSRTTGAIHIQYELLNRDALNSHQVGVLLELDTFVNGNDGASILTSFGYTRTIQQFNAPQLPDFYQAFGGALDNPGLVAQGTLIGLDAVRPDRFVIGEWNALVRVQWDYTVPGNSSYNDSAVLLRWNEQTLLPNASRRVATYFGVGDVTTQSGELTLHLTALRNLQVSNGQLSPNPFDINLLVFNKSGVTATAVQATLQLPVGLALVSGETATQLLAPSTVNNQTSGTATWKVIAQCPLTDIDLSFSVSVAATPNLKNTVVRPIFLPACITTLPNFKISAQPDSAQITAGGTASFQIGMTAWNGFTQAAQLSFWPPTAGVTATFSPPTVSPTSTARFDLRTTRTLAAGEYPFIITATGGGLTRSDSVKMRVLPADITKPVIQNPFPANGATDIARDSKIAVEVYDPAPSAGLDFNSLRMLVNGVAVAFERVSNGTGYTLTYNHPTAPFRLNETVSVNVDASDLAGNKASLAFAFTTLRDSAPPLVFDRNPSRNASNVALQTNITARVRDELAGVDVSSIKMLVNAQTVAAQITPEANAYLIQFQPQRLRDNDTVRVEIRARDLAQPANALAEEYIFATVRDSLAPQLLELQPGVNAKNVAREIEIRARLRDNLTGVDSAAVRLWINDKLERATLQRDRDDLLLSFKPATPFAFNETVRVRIAYADHARVPNATTTAYTFAIVQDSLAPQLKNPSPARAASNVPLLTAITFDLCDDGAGVDSASVKVKVNGQVVARSVRGTPAVYHLAIAPSARLLGNSDTVRIEVTAADLATPVNVMKPEIYFYTLSRDRTPPFTAGHNPERNSRNVSLTSAIALEIRDASPGVDSAAIRMLVNGQKAALQFERKPNGYLVRHISNARWSDNQKITVQVEAQDLAAPANVMAREEYTFTTVRDSLPPRARDFSPRPGEVNVATNALLEFAVEDDLTGVEGNALTLLLNGIAVRPSLSPRDNGFLVRYNLAGIAFARDTVDVQIGMRDRATSPNAASFTYNFVMSQDRTPPFVTDFLPPHEAIEVPSNSAITFQIRDEQTGVDSAAVQLWLNGAPQRLALSGTPLLYSARFQPTAALPAGQQIEATVTARDRATPPNVMPTRTFRFTIAAPLPDLSVVELSAQSDFQLGRATKIKTVLRHEGPPLRENFRIAVRADAATVRDTTIAGNTLSTLLPWETSVRFESAGTHIVEFFVDVDDKIRELNEANNQRELVAQIVEAQVSKPLVSPNPFTPNGDGFNDVAVFDFSTLRLSNPTLHIFDVNGIAIFLATHATSNRIIWDGRDENGRDVQPGVYLFTVRESGANVKSGYVVVAR